MMDLCLPRKWKLDVDDGSYETYVEASGSYKSKKALIKFFYQQKRIFTLVKVGASADAGPHYQKLYGRVTSVCGNRRGQPKRSAMQEPHPGRNTLVIIFTSPSGKYENDIFYT